MTTNDLGDLGQHWFMKWTDAWGHQDITLTILYLSWVRSGNIKLLALSSEIPRLSVTKISLKIAYTKFYSHMPEGNALSTGLAPVTLWACISGLSLSCNLFFDLWRGHILHVLKGLHYVRWIFSNKVINQCSFLLGPFSRIVRNNTLFVHLT